METQPSSRRAPTERLALALMTAMVLAIPSSLYAGLVLHHFYVQGAYFYDTGLMASLAWHSDLTLPTPPIEGGTSFYATHVMPILSILSAASEILPVTGTLWYAWILGVGHALPSLGLFWLLVDGLRLRRAQDVGIATLGAIGFAFNGLALAVVRVPHPEILVAGGLVLIIAAISLGYIWLAALATAISLMLREDAGFHLLAFTFCLAAVERWRGRPWSEQTPILIFGGVGLCYSVAALIAERLAFPDHESAFVRIYLGDPAFGHLSLDVVAGRVGGFLLYRPYLWCPAVVAGFWAARARNPLIMVGYLACLPWTLVQILAESGIAGGLCGYYAFPFLIAAIFPLAAVVIEARRLGVAPNRGLAMAGVGLIFATSLLGLRAQWNPGRMELAAGFTEVPSRQWQARTDKAVAVLLAAREQLGTLAVDQGILSLAPRDFRAGETLAGPTPPTHPTTIAWFEDGYEAEKARALARSEKLDHRYRIPGTSILLASDHPPTAGTPLAGLCQAEPDSQD